MKGLRMKVWTIGLFLVLGVWVGALAQAQEFPIRMCYNGPPDAKENAVHLYAENFKNLVEKATGGRVQITLYPNSQLGNEEQRMEQVMSGPMISVASFAGVAPVFPEIFASSIPFMFNSYKAAHAFFDQGDWWKKAQVEFRKRTGGEVLAVVEEGGFMAFTNSKKEIKSPTDFKGLKFRAMDESQVALYEAFGASGTPIPWTDVYMALKTGVADGQMNPPMYIIMGSLYEVQTDMCLANIQYSDQFLVINGQWLDELPEDVRKAFRQAAFEANVTNRQVVESQVGERVKFIADHGVKVYRPTNEEMDRFRKVGQPSFVEWLKKKMDASWIDLALEEADKANRKVGEGS